MRRAGGNCLFLFIYFSFSDGASTDIASFAQLVGYFCISSCYELALVYCALNFASIESHIATLQS